MLRLEPGMYIRILKAFESGLAQTLQRMPVVLHLKIRSASNASVCLMRANTMSHVYVYVHGELPTCSQGACNLLLQETPLAEPRQGRHGPLYGCLAP